MNAPFGKYWGIAAEWILLHDPAYVCWMLSVASPKGGLAIFVPEVRRLIAALDARPLLAKCHEHRCLARATRGTLCRGVPEILWWCETCDPYFVLRPYTVIRTYLETAQCVGQHALDRNTRQRALILQLAVAKGLPQDWPHVRAGLPPMGAGTAEAVRFFQESAGEDSSVQ
jgi:hypothetical protein